ncbi:hypothetical protein PoMZ_01839 [Pyricularia oryzae]|uniref:Zn(2)-C6 fungal-type domain-containing protein n=1 Tax=Pyricularia oryzae TaxID=318829 RepID=A0A4P7N6V9_PYROR|nr:hypothetical protein PoMZ_01839 [Pyricularia oryzae]
MTSSSTPLSDYTTVFRAKTTDSGTVEATTSAPALDPSRRRIRRRNRPAVACEPCRLRKKKCDRQHPCLGCVGRGDTCYYAAAPALGATGGGVGGSGGGGSTIAGPRGGGSISKGHGGAGSGGGSSRYEAQVRLQRLEDMVSELMGRAQGTGSSSSSGETPETAQSSSITSGPSPASSASPASGRAGELHPQNLSGVVDMAPRPGEHLGGNQEGSTATPFIGATHWSAFLQQIRDLQGYLEHEMAEDAAPPPARTSRTPSPRPSSSGGRLETDFLLERRGARVSIDEIVDTLPPRTECDKLLAAYFCNDFLRAPMLHSVQFQRMYVAFWERPEAASVLWVSMLFSVLYMSSGVELARRASRGRDEGAVFQPKDMEAWPEVVKLGALRDMAARCLVSGDYLKGPEYAVEALALCSFMRLYSIDGETDPMLWAGVGTAIRLAQHLGYHRDPRHLSSTAAVGGPGQERPALSVFAGEMRRRTWYVLEAFDFLLSFRYGVPTVIHGDDTDTDGPTNLIDTDFDEHTTVLPAERPSTDPTNMLYICYKSKSIRLARRLVRHTIRQQQQQQQQQHQEQQDIASSPSYQQTMALDAELRAHLTNMPPSLRLILPICEHAPLTDTPPRIIHRVAADLMYHKSVCVLHRAYLTCGGGGGRLPDPSVEYSRTACRASALRILKVQAEIEREMRPGGRLHGEDYLLGGVVKHDFLLAATIMCLDLVESSSCGSTSLDDQLEKLEVLEMTYGFWYSRRHSSRDTTYAVKVLGAIIAKVKRTNKELAGSTARQWRQQQPPQPPQPQPQQQDSQWLATITSSLSPPVPSSGQAGLVAAAPETFHIQDSMYDLPLDDDFLAINAEDIDWDMIDSFLLDRQSTLDPRQESQDWLAFGPI